MTVSNLRLSFSCCQQDIYSSKATELVNTVSFKDRKSNTKQPLAAF